MRSTPAPADPVDPPVTVRRPHTNALGGDARASIRGHARSDAPGLFRGIVRGLLAALCVLLLTVLGAPAAAAHTELTGTDPADGQVLPQPPPAIALTFTEPVGAAPEAVRLLGPGGVPVPVDVRALDATVEVVPAAPLDEGTHTVAWRVVSADGHPISGSFAFSVGAPGAAPAAAAQEPAPMVGIAHRAAQTLLYIGVLAAAGLTVFELLLLAAPPGAMHRTRRRLHRLARIGAAVAVLGAVVSVPAATMWRAGTDLGALADGALWRSAAGSDTALAAALAVAGVLDAVAGTARTTGPGGTAPARWTALGGAALAAASLLLTGHTRSADPAWLVLTADAVHVATGLTWLGGVLGLAVVMAHGSGASARQATATASRFSAAAGWTALALAVSGTVLGWRLVGGLQPLVSTGYGQLLLIKVAVVLGVVAVAAWNRFVHLPRLLTRPDAAARTALRSALRVEAALLLLVLVVTGVLTSLSP